MKTARLEVVSRHADSSSLGDRLQHLPVQLWKHGKTEKVWTRSRHVQHEDRPQVEATRLRALHGARLASPRCPGTALDVTVCHYLNPTVT